MTTAYKHPKALTNPGQVEQDDTKLHQWLDYPCGRFEGRRLSICMEAGRDPLLWRLEGHEQVDLFAVNTTTAARYRKTFTPSGDKNDQRDAASTLDLMRTHPDRIRPHERSNPPARAIHQLSTARRNAVDRRTGVISSMREVLELYYPVIPKLFDSLSSQIALEFLQRWPDPQSLAKARASTLTDFFHQHRSRSQSRIDKRIELIGQSRALIKDPTLLEVQHMRLHDHINQIKALNKSIGHQTKKKTRRRGSSTSAQRSATAPNDVWSWDFIFDTTEDGQTIKILSIVDEFSRFCIDLNVNRKISSNTTSKKVCTFWRFNPGVKPVATNAVASGFTPRLLEKRFGGKPFENRYKKVLEALDQACERYGAPKCIRSDNGRSSWQLRSKTG